jgi:hypothetical protein
MRQLSPKVSALALASRAFALAALVALLSASLDAHGVSGKDAVYLQGLNGPAIGPLMYLGAKHMVTGYDHLLFLVGVIFFLHRLRDVGAYVTLFAVGLSVTLLFGVLSGIHVNAYLVDAVIGLSVVYKALDNLGAFRRWFGVQPNTKAAVLIFGLVDGFGLATKLQDFAVPRAVTVNPGPDDCRSSKTSECITVSGMPDPTDRKRFILALMGQRALPGLTWPGASVTAYLEAENATTGDREFDANRLSANFNDRLAACPHTLVTATGSRVICAW